jgi:uncharacterized protein
MHEAPPETYIGASKIPRTESLAAVRKLNDNEPIARAMAVYSRRTGYSRSTIDDLYDRSVAAVVGVPAISSHSEATANLSQIVAKVRTDCNFRCTYCYEYEDNDWEDLPPVMSDEVVTILGRRMGEYAVEHSLKRMGVVFHGGEPLFMSKPEAYYDRIVPLLRAAAQEADPSLEIPLSMQTNASLLREPILGVLRDHDVKIGASIDGALATHDKRRVSKASSAGTHRLVMKGIERLRDPVNAQIYSGLLAVIDVTSDPLETYQALIDLEPPRMDLLLPYGTWENPPPVPEGISSKTPYGDWMKAIFFKWMTTYNQTDIRFFSSIMRLSRGFSSATEAIGPDAGGEVVVRTDGAYEFVDALRVTEPGAVNTNLNLHEHKLEAVASRMRAASQLGRKSLSKTCMDCRLVDICGGGHIATRFSKERGLDNPSVYCNDLQVIIDAIIPYVEAQRIRAVTNLLGRSNVSIDQHSCYDC